MGTRNEPNVKVIQKGGGATLAVIADSNAWKPGGLVQPIFWLKTGYRHQQLKRQHL